MVGRKASVKPYIPYAKQSIQEEDIQAVMAALKGEIITRGERVEAFEREVAAYCGAHYAVAYNSGTSALMGAYFAAQISSADRLISTPNTFIATVGAAGIDPHFVDIDRQTGHFDLNRLAEKLNFRATRGRPVIVPVHFAGIPVDMQALDRMLRHPDAVVIEDAAHALGSSYANGQRVGCCAWSHMTVFSFHPAKILTTGEGGMVLTNDPDLYHRLQLHRNNGIERAEPYLEQPSAPGYYEVHALTGNFNFTDFQAALGLSQLSRINDFIARRRRLVKIYREKLKNIPHVQLLTNQHDSHTAFHLMVVQIDFKAYGTTREAVMARLHARGIGTQVHYIPLYRHPVFRKRIRELNEEDYPAMEAYYAQALSLPLYYDLTEEEARRVCRELAAILKVFVG